MRAYKLTVLVVDHDSVGEEIAEMIEDARYPNHCISPSVIDIQSVDIGEWDDSHPLNYTDKQRECVESLNWERLHR